MPLSDLVIKTADIQEAAVEAVVRNYFTYSEDGEILVSNKDFYALPGETKISTYLVAIAGRQFLGLNQPPLAVDGMELSKQLNLKYNSVRAYLSQLRKQGLVIGEGGKYKVSMQGLLNLKTEDRK